MSGYGIVGHGRVGQRNVGLMGTHLLPKVSIQRRCHGESLLEESPGVDVLG